MDFEREIIAIYPWIVRVARKYCWSTQDAEDLANDTVYKALLNKDKFEIGKPLKPWCEVIMQNTYITSYNRKSIIRFVDYDDVCQVVSLRLASERTLFHEILSVIRRCAFKSCCIECVLLYAKGYSYDEISQLLNIPTTTVRSRISFGRELLRRELG